MTEQDIIIRLKDDSGKEYILYPATKAENIIGILISLKSDWIMYQM